MSGNDEGHSVEAHAARIAELVSELEALPDSDARSMALELVTNFDHLHRTCVWRLFEIVSELGGKGLIDRMVSEPSVRALFILYDLIPSEPLTPVESPVPVSAPLSSGFVPLSAVEGLNVEPTWHVVFAKEDLPPGSLRAVEVDGTPLLLASTEEGVYAYRNCCGATVLPLHLGTMADGEIHCPWHGCRYDVATGAKVGSPHAKLEAFRVELQDDKIRVQRRA